MAAKKTTRRRAPRQPKEIPPPDPGPRAEPPPVPAGPTFSVVGIGASAGGLNAMKRFLGPLPADSGIAFVFVPHLDPTHESRLVPLLARHTTLPVVEVAEGMAVVPNHIYVIPPNQYLTIREGVLHLGGPVEPGNAATAIDRFLRSLAEDLHERAVGIILSGTGSYGTLGLEAVKANGGMAMVQDPDTAERPDMPRSAVATGLADYVLAPEQIPEALVRYVRQPYVSGGVAAEASPESADWISRILGVVLAHSRCDFRRYRQPTVRRRIERRMGLRGIKSLPDYLSYLRGHPEEAQNLARDLLIGVTSFFRDAGAFRALEVQALIPLVESKEEGAPVRVWVPSCATGEEAYSIAILLLEQFTRAHKTCRLQVLATDVNEAALAGARRGIYPEGIAADVSPERLGRFFTRTADGRYLVVRDVREPVTFAVQNVITDAPFPRLDLISCRNVLIYLEPEVQQHILAVFHYALNEGGYLFLGPSETVGHRLDLFQPISKRWRLYRRIGPARVAVPLYWGRGGQATARSGRAAPAGPNFPALAQRLLLEEFAPAAVLANRALDVLYFHGPTTRYLEQPSGTPTQNLIALARDGLRAKLRTAIKGAVQARQSVTLTGVRIKHEGTTAAVRVTIHPVSLPGTEEGLLLVTFENEPQPASPAGTAAVTEGAAVRELAADLLATREDLQMTVEELETANEELKAANEELSSMNAELQSTNQELEAAEGAWRRLNEDLERRVADRTAELQAANEGLRAEIAERQRLAAIVESSDDAVIGKTLDGTIVSWNAAAERTYGYSAAEAIGRSIDLIYPREQREELLSILDRLKEGEHVAHFKTRRVGKDGRTIIVSVSISPVKDAAGLVVGASAIARDVTEQERMEEIVRLQGQVAAHLADGVSMVRQRDATIVYTNERFEELFGYGPGELLGKHVADLNAPGDRSPEEGAEGILGALREKGVWKGEVENVRKDGTRFWTHASITTFSHPEHGAVWISVQRDVTERKQMEDRLREGRERLQAILASAGDAIITIDQDGLIESVNPAAEKMFGYGTGELIGQNVALLMSAPQRRAHGGYLDNYLRSGVKKMIGTTREVLAQHKEGFTFPAELTVSEVGQLRLFTGILRDISRRKELEREVLEIAALEQRRIGQELHDSVGQELTGLGLMADALAQRLEQSPAEAELAARVATGLERVHRQVRFLSRGLIPVEVDPEGLRAALEELAGRTGEQAGIACTFESAGPVRVTDATTAGHLFRIAQEAVTNALRHGQAQHIHIALGGEGNTLTLSVQDDGVGIRNQVEERKGLGIRLMRNRAGLIGATLTVGPAEDSGTLVRCILTRESGDA